MNETIYEISVQIENWLNAYGWYVAAFLTGLLVGYLLWFIMHPGCLFKVVEGEEEEVDEEEEEEADEGEEEEADDGEPSDDHAGQ